MKKLLILLILLILFIPFFANARGLMMVGSAVTTVSAPDECTGKLICQNFQTPTTGWDNSESWTCSGGGAADPVDTTATVLRGTQQLKITDAGGDHICVSPTFSASNEVWAHYRTKISSITNTHILFRLRNSTTLLGYVRVNSTGALAAFHGTATCVTSTGVVSADTKLHIWVHYIADTEADDTGTMEIAYSTCSSYACSRPAYACTITTGTSDAAVDNIALVGDNNTTEADTYFDQVLVDDSDTLSSIAE